MSWSWSHCLVCWKPSGDGWQPETCKIMGLIRFGGLCAIWLVWRGSHFKALKRYLRSSYTLTVEQSHKYFSTINKPLGCLVLWWLDQATAPTSYETCGMPHMHVLSEVRAQTFSSMGRSWEQGKLLSHCIFANCSLNGHQSLGFIYTQENPCVPKCQPPLPLLKILATR